MNPGGSEWVELSSALLWEWTKSWFAWNWEGISEHGSFSFKFGAGSGKVGWVGHHRCDPCFVRENVLNRHQIFVETFFMDVADCLPTWN